MNCVFYWYKWRLSLYNISSAETITSSCFPDMPHPVLVWSAVFFEETVIMIISWNPICHSGNIWCWNSATNTDREEVEVIGGCISLFISHHLMISYTVYLNLVQWISYNFPRFHHLKDLYERVCYITVYRPGLWELCCSLAMISPSKQEIDFC